MFAKALELAVGSGPGEGGDTLVAPPSKEMAGLHLGWDSTGLACWGCRQGCLLSD